MKSDLIHGFILLAFFVYVLGKFIFADIQPTNIEILLVVVMTIQFYSKETP